MRQLLVFLALTVFLFANGQRLPANSRILYFGDSQTSFGYNANGVSVQYQNFGYIAWVNALCPSVWTPKGGVLAIPGETTNHMVNRLGALANYDAKIVVVMAGTNDPLYAISPETTKANLRRTYNAGISAGMRVIAITILPRFAQNTYSPAVEANRLAINEWIKAQTDVLVVDAEKDLYGAEYFDDGLHTSTLGAYVLGKKVADVVNTLVEPVPAGSVTAADLSVSQNSNPLMLGTGGRISNATGESNASGTVANNWQLVGNFATPAQVVGSKSVDENGKEQQVISISGSYIGQTRKVTLNNYVTHNPPASQITLYSGQVVHGIAEIEIPTAMTNIKCMYLKLQAYSPAYASTLAEAYSMFPTSGKQNMMPPGKYLLRTPPMTITEGTVGELVTQVMIEFMPQANTAPVSMVMKINSIGIRQLPPTQNTTISPAGPLTLCPGSSAILSVSPSGNYTYSWMQDGKVIADSTRSSFVARTPGSYTVAIGGAGWSRVSEPTVISSGTCGSLGTSIQTGTVPQALCSRQTLNIPFTATGSFEPGNRFTAQLSDATGSFNNPVNIGVLTDVTGSVIPVNIPLDVQPGSNYRIRVVASNPATTGTDNGQNIQISLRPSAAINPAGTVTTSANMPVTLTASPQTNHTFQWLAGQNRINPNGTSSTYTTSTAGVYRAIVTSAAGCVDTSAATTVNLVPCAAINLNVNSTDSQVFTVAASGGSAPYQYSLDSVTFQSSNSFSNLLFGKDYTVYVKDAQNCTGTTRFTLQDVTSQDPQQAANARSTTFIKQSHGSSAGIVVVPYDMLTQPDQMDIHYNGSRVATTAGTVSGKGWLWFNFNPHSGASNSAIRFSAPADGADWWYKSLSPISSYVTHRTGEDQVCNGIYVSPNFPNGFSPNTNNLHTLTPTTSGTKIKAEFRSLLIGSGTLSVYDGPDASSPLLGEFTGNYGNAENPSITATNASGKLTFRFNSGTSGGQFGWVAAISCVETKVNQTITFNPLSNKVYGDAPFNISATASSGLTVSFRIVSGPAKLSGNTVTLNGTGEVVIEATQAGDANYSAATAVSRSFTVSSAGKQNQTITFPAITSKSFGDAPFAPSATASSGLPVSYQIVSGPATITGGNITLNGAGSVTIEAQQGGDASYNPAATVTQNFTVAKAGQNITFAAISDRTFSNVPFALNATTTSGLPATFRVVSGPATVSGNNVTITGTGLVTIEAAQAGNADYHPATALTNSFNVTAASQVITFNALAARRTTDAPFTVSATASSGLAVSFRVVSGPATVSGNTVTLTGATGTVTIEAAQAGNNNYNAANPVTQSFSVTNVAKQNQTITFPSLPYRTYTSPPFGAEATASSGLPVSYRVVSGPATMAGNIITITGVGSVMIEATQAGDASFNAATPVQRGFTVGKASQTISFTPPTEKFTTDPPFVLDAVATSGLQVSYRVVSGPATVSGNMLTLTGPGTVSIEATQPGNNNFNASFSVTRTINVVTGSSTTVKQNQTINFPAVAPVTLGVAPFTLNATASSGLPVSYRVVSGSASITGSNLTITGAGSVTVEANQAGNNSLNPAPPVTQTIVVNKAAQSISFDALASKFDNDGPFVVSAAASSGLAVSFRVVSGPATVSGNTVTLTGATGTVTIEAAQAGNSNYNAANPVTQSFTVLAAGMTKLNQTINFGTLSYRTYVSPPFTLSATSSSGLPVSFRVVSGPVTISGNTVTITGVGAVTIEAMQTGNSNYNAAPPVQRSFTVGKAGQTITYGTLPAKIVSDPPFTLSATTTSGLQVLYRVVSGPATVSGNTVTLTGATGTVTIEATQPGDANFSAAFALQRSFTVSVPSTTTQSLKRSETSNVLRHEDLVSPAGSITVFPNPVYTTGAVKVTVSQSLTGVLSIYDNEGRLVRSLANIRFEKGQATVVTLDIKDLSSGTYIICLQARGTVLNAKFQLLK